MHEAGALSELRCVRSEQTRPGLHFGTCKYSQPNRCLPFLL